jgi:hypothetical protein
VTIYHIDGRTATREAIRNVADHVRLNLTNYDVAPAA